MSGVTRAALGALGTALLVAGLRRRSRRGIVLAVAGGLLLSGAIGENGRLRQILDPREDRGRSGDRTTATAGTAASRSITVGKTPEELYEIWRDPDRVSAIMGHFADVTAADDDRFRWSIDGPGGREVSWETRFVAEEPGELLRWQSTEDAIVPNEGSVRFRPASGDRGTIVTFSVDFDPPGGSVGAATLDRFEIVPASLVGAALDRCKSLAESGEIPTLDGNPSARGRGDLL